MGNLIKFLKSNIVLILIILFSLFLTFYPHLHYKYPLHIDEWVHLTWSKEIMSRGNIPNYDPFLSWYRPYNTFEDGYHVFLSSFFLITNLNPIHISLIFPLFFTFVMVLSVYFLAITATNNKTVALLSALIVGTTPSDVMFLGHVFAVPLNVGLIFVPLIFLFAEKEYYLPLALLLGASFLMYPPAGVVSVIGLIVFYVMKIIYQKSFSLKKALASLFFGVALGMPLILTIVFSSQGIQFSPYFFMVDLIKYFSYPLAVLAIIGIVYKFRETYSPLFAYIFSLVLLFIPFKFLKFGFLVPYERLILFFFPILAIYSAMGIFFLVKFLPKFRNILLALVFIAIAYFSIVSNLHSYNNYYHIISDDEYNFYTSIKETTPKDSVFLIAPDKAVAFVPISERKTISWLSNTPDFNEVYYSIEKYYKNQMNQSEKNEFFKLYNIDYIIINDTLIDPYQAKSSI